MQGVRRRNVASTRQAQRSRFCRRCGAPLALAPSAVGGVRCSNCGAEPGTLVRSATDLAPVHGTLPTVTGLVPVPMRLDPPVDVWTRRREAAQARAHAALALMARARRWAEELPPPSLRTWITAVAVGIAIALAVAVVVTLG
jgi:hypothetical protein